MVSEDIQASSHTAYQEALKRLTDSELRRELRYREFTEPDLKKDILAEMERRKQRGVHSR